MSSQSQSTAEELDPVQRFFRYFQLEATALQDQMAKLEGVPTVGGERMDAIDHCLAGISRLQREVQDASSYTSTYDQKMYSEGIKALYEKLGHTRASLAPKQKFSFKSSVKKNNSAVSLNDAAELAKQQHVPLSKPVSPEASVSHGSLKAATPPNEGESTSHSGGLLGQRDPGRSMKTTDVPDEDAEESPPEATIRKMSFASASTVDISSHSNVHIILPSSATHATTSGSLMSLEHCIIDLSVPILLGQPFAALTIKDVHQSLLVCGKTSGSAHITNVRNSVIVVTANQFRMHRCHSCIVYLLVNSRPIIEDCNAIQFAPLAQYYITAERESAMVNQWDKVQDFNWLKSSASPNWKELPQDHRVSEEVWAAISQGGLEWTLDGILAAVGVS